MSFKKVNNGYDNNNKLSLWKPQVHSDVQMGQILWIVHQFLWAYRNCKCTSPCGESMITSKGQKVKYGGINWPWWFSAHSYDQNYPDKRVLNQSQELSERNGLFGCWKAASREIVQGHLAQLQVSPAENYVLADNEFGLRDKKVLYT